MSSALLAKIPEDLSATFSAFDIFMAVSPGDLVFVCSEDGRPEIEVRIEGEGEEMVAVPTGRQQPCTVDKSSTCACPADCDCLSAACPCRSEGEAGVRWCDADPADACACHEQCGCPAECPCDDPDFCYCADDGAECVCGSRCVCGCGARRA
jgi:hypothetical protein